MRADELLTRIATTLRNDVAPAVGNDYSKTQTYMATVILNKLAAELRAEQTMRAEREADEQAMYEALVTATGGATLPAALETALNEARQARDDTSQSRLVEQLYAHREALGEARFNELLGVIRAQLKARLERELEVAR